MFYGYICINEALNDQRNFWDQELACFVAFDLSFARKGPF